MVKTNTPCTSPRSEHVSEQPRPCTRRGPCSWNAARSRPYVFQHLLRHFLFPCWLWGGGEWGGGVRTSFVLRPCTKHWYLPRFRFFVQHTVQECGTGHVVTSVHASCDDAQNTGIYRVFASLYNTLCKNVEQDTLSQASMPVATMHRTLVFTAFSLLCTTHCARIWNRTRCHQRPCQLRRFTKHWYLPRFRFFVQHTVQECGPAPESVLRHMSSRFRKQGERLQPPTNKSHCPDDFRTCPSASLPAIIILLLPSNSYLTKLPSSVRGPSSKSPK